MTLNEINEAIIAAVERNLPTSSGSDQLDRERAKAIAYPVMGVVADYIDEIAREAGLVVLDARTPTGSVQLANYTDVARLRDALQDALEGLEDMRPYVPDYFADKWDHDDYIDRARSALFGEDQCAG